MAIGIFMLMDHKYSFSIRSMQHSGTAWGSDWKKPQLNAYYAKSISWQRKNIQTPQYIKSV
ncbi:hypothetical protein ATZ36_02920 [Candidatus Endomicrobiellum trichonymphae]|uniref:Uncharacterized protein n=1 Tax=Endomicrobium trichonymphae TaxID=1408204 RepID=A0A1E5IKP6_ENDTX|nr:hypothetical protein ATZ36_00975 [Candidatus Endomicrobium trichonymphae]OEG71079.1 hypothetical protein ATZ36_02920 [Candidatus Endomicrobium trichonymphae]